MHVHQKLINQNIFKLGYGIYTTEGDELAAWMVQSYYGAMFSMQTKPEHRRRG